MASIDFTIHTQTRFVWWARAIVRFVALLARAGVPMRLAVHLDRLAVFQLRCRIGTRDSGWRWSHVTLRGYGKGHN